MKQKKFVPMIPLRGLVAYPGMMTHFDIGREASLKALETIGEYENTVFVAAQKDTLTELPLPDDIYNIGVLMQVKHIVRLPDGISRVLAMGIEAGRITDMRMENGSYQVTYNLFRQKPEQDDTDMDALVMAAKALFKDYARQREDFPAEFVEAFANEKNPSLISYLMAFHSNCSIEKKQAILENPLASSRIWDMMVVLENERELLSIESDIRNRVRERIDKGQKQYYLREQIQVIRQELGEDDENAADTLRAKVEKSNMPQAAKDMALRELRRLEHMAPGTPDISVTRSYVEFMLELPWGEPEERPFKLEKAKKILEGDHYGLDKVKERVLEYLALRAFNPKGKAPILCLVGAPGVGKTSIARSIAHALNRKFVRLSLGGIHDEAEIRGHRRTYIGAMSGRILSLIRQAGTVDPVFLLDEIDKLTSDMRGDPASALLEALDPEQNSTFSDHYVETPYDLSHVLFITTANTTDTIPAPLLDRMELIEVPSYTLEEKMQIAKKHLWPKQMAEVGLAKGQVKLSDKLLREVIEGYTAEAGVRTLERQLQAILRKSAMRLMEVAEEERKPVTVTASALTAWLGASRNYEQQAGKEPEIGIVNGLAWTSIGGKTLSVEATVMPGNGALDLTGQLGDVMKESAKAAYSYIRSHSDRYAIASDFHAHNDLHVHFPEGAVPKDGPSAGVAVTCAMLSAITGRPARQDVAMTGEITLRGKVLPIGGVKEKLLAAYRLGVKTVLVPEDNKRDLIDVPEEVRKKLDIRTISGVDQAINIVLGGNA